MFVYADGRLSGGGQTVEGVAKELNEFYLHK